MNQQLDFVIVAELGKIKCQVVFIPQLLLVLASAVFKVLFGFFVSGLWKAFFMPLRSLMVVFLTYAKICPNQSHPCVLFLSIYFCCCNICISQMQ